MRGKVAETPSRRPPTRPARGSSAKRRKKTLRLSELALQRIGVAAKMTARTESDVVEELVLSHLKRFVVTDREKPGSGGGEAPIAGTIGAEREAG